MTEKEDRVVRSETGQDAVNLAMGTHVLYLIICALSLIGIGWALNAML